ncbi:hypothetical protein ACFT8P_26245 [Streptomyces sp. NPDC057101]|uniref:hypothetical protein n=1 Tax=Streptomyces sp. NPDC057101 TaxID=3346020 RepID=UPI0036288012
MAGFLRLISLGGAPCPPELAHEAGDALGCCMRTVFGITEGGGRVITLGPDEKFQAAAVAEATCAGRSTPRIVGRRLAGLDAEISRLAELRQSLARRAAGD